MYISLKDISLSNYVVDEEGQVYNKNTGKALALYNNRFYELISDTKERKTITKRKLLMVYFNKPMCEDTIKDLPGEQWKRLKDTFYYVSNMGRIKSLYGYNAKLLKPGITKKGYLRV